MKSEKEIMLEGGMYDPNDPILVVDRIMARNLSLQYNSLAENEVDAKKNILRKLIPNAGINLGIQAPFFCDYGYNIICGDHVFFNFNCIILDVTYVKIGSRTMCGPNVQIYTATHPVNHKERSSGREYSKPITIGEDVWLGGSVVICPGVTIGDRAVIGAGSVVTKDIPNDVFAAGNPCRVIKKI